MKTWTIWLFTGHGSTPVLWTEVAARPDVRIFGKFRNDSWTVRVPSGMTSHRPTRVYLAGLNKPIKLRDLAPEDLAKLRSLAASQSGTWEHTGTDGTTLTLYARHIQAIISRDPEPQKA